jgi:hypothetical protein
VVLTHSPNLHARQAAGLDQTLAKAIRALTETAGVLEHGTGRRDRTAVEKDLTRVLRPRWLDRIVHVTLTGEEPSQLRLTWTIDGAARKALETELFGKRILITDRDDWPVVDLVAALPLPERRRTRLPPTQRPPARLVLTHVALDRPEDPGARLLLRQSAGRRPPHAPPRHPRRPPPQRELLAQLAGIQETLLLYPSTGGRPRARRTVTEMTPTQRQLYDLFDLNNYAPTSPAA